ncbi:MAG: cation:proton antiporter [Planctomycetota bacterium]|jgi:CPA1 family monovalent cation:H+ antiporter
MDEFKSIFSLIAVLLSLAALFVYINFRFIRLPRPIGLVIISVFLSLLLMGLSTLGVTEGLEEMVRSIHFDQTLLVGMLSFLLFAGALHVDINDLRKKVWEISIFATVGVLCSCFLVGTGFFYIFRLAGLDIPYVYCLLFGALISPTDPIAVLGILKKAGTPKGLEIKITGESLFNDGFGVVLFVVLLGLAGAGHDGGHAMSAGDVGLLLLKEVGGGTLIGLGAGWLVFQALKRVDDYTVEILLTLALVFGTYALALNLHASGPIAIVLAGLMIGNHGRSLAMSDRTREHLDMFWELIDEILNAVLFVLIGLEILVVSLTGERMLFGLIAIPVALLARFISIGIPVKLMSRLRTYSPRIVRILTWGGLRGGISVALALSLPEGPYKDTFLTMTYSVVLFSLVVQGLTIRYLVPPAAEIKEDDPELAGV